MPYVPWVWATSKYLLFLGCIYYAAPPHLSSHEETTSCFPIFSFSLSNKSLILGTWLLGYRLLFQPPLELVMAVRLCSGRPQGNRNAFSICGAPLRVGICSPFSFPFFDTDNLDTRVELEWSFLSWNYMLKPGSPITLLAPLKYWTTIYSFNMKNNY